MYVTMALCIRDITCIKWETPRHQSVFISPVSAHIGQTVQLTINIQSQRSVAVQDVLWGGCEGQDDLMGEMYV